jgi:hypothetical protein
MIMGVSHEAPMMRGIEEWNRHAVSAVRDSAGTVVPPGHDPYGGTGEWSFRRNADALKAYWRDGIRRMADQDFEGVVTLGMRGNGDTSLPDGDGVELMREIIDARRTIIAEVTGRDPASVPQVWTLYKEVQRYWDRGLRAPDDVTVVPTDDNWGNIRKHPDPAEPARPGGYGLYHHFDYVGAGRNYKWVDTAGLPNLWDQLHQAHAYGNHGLWVTNVGDLKGNELPTEFFLDYAWNPGRWDGPGALGEWERRYARQNFGTRHAARDGDRGRTGDVRTTPVAPQAGTPQPPDHPRPGIGRGGVRRPGNPLLRPRTRAGHAGAADARGTGRADRATAAGFGAGRMVRADRLRGRRGVTR